MRTKKQKTLLLLLVMMMTVLSAMTVHAGFATHVAGAYSTKFPKSQTVVLDRVKMGKTVFVDSTTYFFSKKVVSVKSSNKKVASIQRINNKMVVVQPKKAGKTTLTVKCSGKTYKCKFKVVRYKNPFKSVVVCGTNVTGEFNKYDMNTTSSSEVEAAAGKISVSLKKGYSKMKIYVDQEKVNNNGQITLDNNYSDLWIDVYNKATKQTERYALMLFFDDDDDWY